MDAYLSNSQNSGNSFDPPPILIAADSESGKARALGTVTMAGFRVADSVGIEVACERISRQGAASALWIELDADTGVATDRLLDHVAADVAHGRYSAVVAAPASLVDRLAAHAFDLNMDLIIDADESERAAALAIAVSGALKREKISDVTADKNAVRLRQLSDEVSRIAATLARLSTGPEVAARVAEAEPLGDVPEVSVDMLRAIIRARRLRSRYFDEELFADPAWDMLLDLLYAEISNLRVPVSSLRIAAAVPPTTGLRWLKTRSSKGYSSAKPIHTMAGACSSNWHRRAVRHFGATSPMSGRPPSSSAACPRKRPVARRRRGRLAQLVEHLVYTERVGGSSPSPPTITHRPPSPIARGTTAFDPFRLRSINGGQRALTSPVRTELRLCPSDPQEARTGEPVRRRRSSCRGAGDYVLLPTPDPKPHRFRPRPLHRDR
jgi:hypothetical protein